MRTMKKYATVTILLMIIIPAVQVGSALSHEDTFSAYESIPFYDYELINTFPHDSTAFTQGLIYKDGFLYEGTGIQGNSSLRKVIIETGEVQKIFNLPDEYFGEGITAYHDTIFQLTYLNHIGFVYVESDTFELIDSFSHSFDGWGLTHDDTSLIASDGTQRIYYLDPHSFEEVGRIRVTADGSPIFSVNELEYIQGKIYANLLGSSLIAIIDPQTGEVEGWLNLNGIRDNRQPEKYQNPLNGIAFDPVEIRLFVTGKLWPELFEITVDPLNYPPEIVSSSPPSPVFIDVDSTSLLVVHAADPDPEDSLDYTWTVNGITDSTSHDSTYMYTGSAATTDTVAVYVGDGMFTDSTSWSIHVGTVGIGGGQAQPEHAIPVRAELLQNYPNPFNPVTTFSFSVPDDLSSIQPVELTIHDIRGKRVRTLIDSPLHSGNHMIVWDGRDDRGEKVGSGIYIATLRTGETVLSRKVTVLY